MRLSSYVTIAVTFLCAAGLCLVAAGFSVTLIEENSKSGVRRALDRQGITWADADANGLQLFLIGTAPSEAERFKAITVGGSIVDSARVIDQMEVADREAFAPPRFSVEILRNDSGISLIGLIPFSSQSDEMIKNVNDLAKGQKVSDFLETARYPAPEGWDTALEFALSALKQLPRSKLSVDANSVLITAMTDSAEQKRKLEAALRKDAPDDLNLALNISAPRPVISPFTLRFVSDDEGARFVACSADSDEAAEMIVAAARRAGMSAEHKCRIGLGVPSRNWAKGVALAIDKLNDLGGGSVTFADADIALVAKEGTDQALFDRVVGELETGLPEVFALKSVLPVPEDASQGPPEFVATLSPEGQVQLRGRVNSDLSRSTADSYAKARFGSADVYTAARVDEDLPRDWQVRVLAAIEALSSLNNGSVTVNPDKMRVFGDTGSPTAEAEITQLLADKLGEAEDFSIEVTYKKKLDPVLGLPTPEECEIQLADMQVGRKISFEPGSDTLDASAKEIMDDFAELLMKCGDIKLEIGGHTDSQGREIMNQQLSQSRAQSVLNALRERRVPSTTYTVKGYGEEMPIADNGTEEGREANRRIEFKLIRPEEVEEQATTLDAISETAQEDGEVDQDSEGTSDEQN